jgi:protein PhnA
MSLESDLQVRSASKCELCGATKNLVIYEIPPKTKGGIDESLLICETCKEQIENSEIINPNHWRCLNESMWSQIPAVQVMSWRMLNRLNSESWSRDLLEMLYLDEETLAWAQASGDGKTQDDSTLHKDSNGNVLQAGDTVVLIKDLDVKGANFTAKRGTSVRGISLVADNSEHIEGKVNGQLIVILTKYVKK